MFRNDITYCPSCPETRGLKYIPVKNAYPWFLPKILTRPKQTPITKYSKKSEEKFLKYILTSKDKCMYLALLLSSIIVFHNSSHKGKRKNWIVACISLFSWKSKELFCKQVSKDDAKWILYRILKHKRTLCQCCGISST